MSQKLFSNLTASRNGMIDGIKKIPALDDDSPIPFENRIYDKANRVISKLYEFWQKIDAKLHSQQQEAQSRYDQAQQNYEQCKEAKGRDAWFDRAPRWYLPFIILLGIVELYINRQVFIRFGFQNHEYLSNHESWILALILSFSLPVAGHFLGLFLRERPWNKTLRWWALIATATSCTTIGYISWLRANIIHSGNGASGDIPVWLFFLSLNLLVFLVATVAAYHTHEEYPQLLKYKQDFQTFERRLRQLQGKRNSLKAAYENKARAIVHRAKELINIYRQANIRKREDGIPEAFKKMPPDIKLPSFTQMEFAELKASPHIMLGAPLAGETSEFIPSNGGHTNQSEM